MLTCLGMSCKSQDKGIDISGTWQFKTNSLYSGLLDNYKFDKNSESFEFRTNEFNGLKRIIGIGAKYKIDQDTLIFNVLYSIEYVNGHPIRSMTATLSDSWELIDGEVKKIEYKEELIEKATISKEFDKDKGVEYILIDDKAPSH